MRSTDSTPASERLGSSPIDLIAVACPGCGHTYTTGYRPSINTTLDPWATDEYIEEMTTGRCPRCGHVVDLGGLVVRVDDDGAEVWEVRHGS